jgi:hypothetical protein
MADVVEVKAEWHERPAGSGREATRVFASLGEDAKVRCELVGRASTAGLQGGAGWGITLKTSLLPMSSMLIGRGVAPSLEQARMNCEGIANLVLETLAELVCSAGKATREVPRRPVREERPASVEIPVLDFTPASAEELRQMTKEGERA